MPSSHLHIIVRFAATWTRTTVIFHILISSHKVRVLHILLITLSLTHLIHVLAHLLLHLRVAHLLVLHWIRLWVCHLLLLLRVKFLISSSLLILSSSLCLLVVQLNAFLDIELQLSAFPGWELVKFKFKHISIALINAFLNKGYDSFLLLSSDFSNISFQLGLLIHGHWFVWNWWISHLFYDLLNRCHLRSLWLDLFLHLI